jgi:excisionase family DNA binding protein
MIDNGLQKLLKPKETAAILGVSERTLLTYTQRGEIPAVRIGRSVRYDPADLRAWIDRQKPAPFDG